MMPIDTVLFDWDGTLIDSAQMAFVATQRALIDLGIALDSEAYETIYSPDWRRMYRALQLPLQQWDEADSLWIHYYGKETPSLVEGCRSVLEALVGKYCLGIVTNGSRSRVLREMDVLGVAEAFDVVITGDDVLCRKPDPEGLISAMKNICKQPQDCCYVGDSQEDVAMGKSAGVLTIGVRSKYPGSLKLLNAGPDLFIESLPRLIDIVNNQFIISPASGFKSIF
jgi:HAD superfamily hydrolase (TIGR01509 family)